MKQTVKAQLRLFDVRTVYRSLCVHGIPIRWTAHECPQRETDPGDEPRTPPRREG